MLKQHVSNYFGLGLVKKLLGWLILGFAMVFVSPCSAQQTASTVLENILQPAGAFRDEIYVGQEPIYHTYLLVLFYQTTEFELAWGKKKNISDLLQAIHCAGEEGLNPQDYHSIVLRQYELVTNTTEVNRAYYDILLTDAFFSYSTDLLRGKTDPELMYSGKWRAERRELNLVMLLQDALQGMSISSTCEGLKPGYEGYKRLKNQLNYLYSIKGQESEIIPQVIPIEPDQRDERIPLVRKRLLVTGHLGPSQQQDSDRYDADMVLAIQKFQQQHGLRADGMIGKQTIDVLNYSWETYINKVLVNLERYRWLPWELDENSVRVNIPAYQLTVHEHDSVILTMKVIVGRPDRTTPVFNSVIQYIIFNPVWTVPPTILKEDILPAVKQDMGYLKRHSLRVVTNKGEEIDPSTLPWSTFTAKNFPYQLRQDPGVHNSLGLIKFQFPNQFSVFLHDTNAHYLFSESYRALSSGCIRIEHPFSLAIYALNQTSWTQDKIDKQVLSGKTFTIRLPNPIPIYIQYWTAYVDEDNMLQWREDVYGLDQPILTALGMSDSPRP